MISSPEINISSIGPELTVLLTAIVILVVDRWVAKRKPWLPLGLGLAGLALALGVTLSLWNQSRAGFGGLIAADNYALFFNLIFLIAAAMTFLVSRFYLDQNGMQRGKYYVLLLFALLGMMVTASGTDLLTIFLGLETSAVSLYALAGFLRGRVKSNESALKYILLGAFSTGFFLYGVALVYGGTGTTNLGRIADHLAKTDLLSSSIMLAGMGLLIVGFGFKVAAVPFHFWAPDVYEGAPTPIAAFISVGPKAAAFAAFLRVFSTALPALKPQWTPVLYVLAILTMTLGNLAALSQWNIKRMLAYSCIAHAGYVLVALVAGEELGNASVLFYLFVYSLMNLGVFTIAILINRRGKGNYHLNDYAGLGTSHPLLGAVMALFMLSLAGIPPTAGFFGKFYIFAAAVKSDYIWLAAIGILNWLVSVYYYLRIVVTMYMIKPEIALKRVRVVPEFVVVLLVSALGILGLGLFPSGLMFLVKSAVIF
ncbi:NADH-quinone oxidoreductase subunit N [candidate division KSB1 bacterium]|nr:NADH-quinone oxidoreductase subunit N [candidate division KSB1 bacterium]